RRLRRGAGRARRVGPGAGPRRRGPPPARGPARRLSAVPRLRAALARIGRAAARDALPQALELDRAPLGRARVPLDVSALRHAPVLGARDARARGAARAAGERRLGDRGPKRRRPPRRAAVLCVAIATPDQARRRPPMNASPATPKASVTSVPG